MEKGRWNFSTFVVPVRDLEVVRSVLVGKKVPNEVKKTVTENLHERLHLAKMDKFWFFCMIVSDFLDNDVELFDELLDFLNEFTGMDLLSIARILKCFKSFWNKYKSKCV